MRAPSIRLRLTAWNAAVQTAILVGLGTSVYLVMSQALMKRIDEALAFEYEEIAEWLRGVEPGGEALAELPDAFLETYQLRIEDHDGHVRIESRSLSGIALPRPPARVIQGSSWFGTIPLGRLGPHRAVVGSVLRPDGVRIIWITASLDIYEQELSELRVTLLTILPAGLLAASVGGYWLARRGLAPIRSDF